MKEEPEKYIYDDMLNMGLQEYGQYYPRIYELRKNFNILI